jgi:hypothetical protein
MSVVHRWFNERDGYRGADRRGVASTAALSREHVSEQLVILERNGGDAARTNRATTERSNKYCRNRAQRIAKPFHAEHST